MNDHSGEWHSINGRIKPQMVSLVVVRNSAWYRQQKDVRVGVVEEQPCSLHLADAAIQTWGSLSANRMHACMFTMAFMAASLLAAQQTAQAYNSSFVSNQGTFSRRNRHKYDGQQ